MYFVNPQGFTKDLKFKWLGGYKNVEIINSVA